jgi:sugar/nucleoside kinase (ribokinase family)
MGSCYVHINCFDFPFSDGLKTETETVGGRYEVVLGGSALIFARVGAAVGLKPIFIGKVGKDIPGRIIQELMARDQIEPALIESEKVQTNLAPQYINPEGQTLITVVGSANQSLEAAEVVAKIDRYLSRVKYLYLGGYFKLTILQPHYPEIIAKAKQNQVKVILDHGRVTNIVTPEKMKHLKELIPAVDVYLPSEDEFLTVWGFNDVEEGLQNLQQTISGTRIVVKRAAKGAAGLSEGEIVHVPAFPVKPMNTAGAGDSFNAGFIKAQIDGKNFKDSLRFAAATAAVKISQLQLPTTDSIEDLLQT